MKVELRRFIPWSDLERQMHDVPLLRHRETKPYEYASIRLREVAAEELSASSLYVIQRNLDFQRSLREALLPLGYDTLHLPGGLDIMTEAETDKGVQQQEWTIIPPVVEVMHEQIEHLNPRGDVDHRGKPTTATVHIIDDGMHRVYLARELGTTVNVVHISGISVEHPYYALQNGWDQVRIFTDVPATMEEKKFYRRGKEASYELYRDFSVLGNIGGPRKTGAGEVKK